MYLIQKTIRFFKEKKPVKVLTLAYIAALSLIAGMSIGTHLVVEKVISEQESSARTINIAGRQRMLSQQSALYMTKLIHNGQDENIREKLTKAINIFEQSNIALTQGSEEFGIPLPIPQMLEKFYFEGPNALDKQVKQYVADINSLLALNPNTLNESAPAFMRAYNAADGYLLENLDKAVHFYEREAERKIQNLINIQKIAIVSILLIILIEAVMIFRPLVRKVGDYSEELEDLAAKDFLTGINNRRSFYQYVGKEIKRSARYDRNMSLILLDLDHFKAVNDTYGHQAGDEVLKQSVTAISESLREEDIFGRVGGEEFAILLPETGHDKAALVTKKILKVLRENKVILKAGSEKDFLQVTSSAGLVQLKSHDKDDASLETVGDLFHRADEALYKAKENGRDRFVVG